MKQYLLDTFSFNDKANKQMLEKIKQMPDQKGNDTFFAQHLRRILLIISVRSIEN